MAGKRLQYRASLEWADPSGTTRASTFARNHTVRIAGKPDLTISADATFRGDPAWHDPEDLLVVALASCHMLSYLWLCGRASIAVTHYEDEAEGTMALDATGNGRFERVVLHPRVTIGAGDAAKAKELHGEAHRLCYIANSVNFPVDCEPTISGG